MCCLEHECKNEDCEKMVDPYVEGSIYCKLHRCIDEDCWRPRKDNTDCADIEMQFCELHGCTTEDCPGRRKDNQSLQISRCGSVIGAAARPKTVRRRVIMTLMKRVCGGCAIGTGVWRSIETWKRIDYIITNCQPAHDIDQIVSFGALGSDHP